MNRLFLFYSICLTGIFATAQNGKIGIGTTMPQAQLHTTGSVRFDTLKGRGLRPVYADSNGTLINSSPVANTVPVPIPDYDCTGASSAIIITGMSSPVPSSDIQVKVNITHDQMIDLAVFLVAPNGEVLNLADHNNGSHQNFENVFFSDFGGEPINVDGTLSANTVYQPFGNTYAVSPNCTFTGTVTTFGDIGGGSIIPNGTWTLKVLNLSQSGVGFIGNWSINFYRNALSTASNFLPKTVGSGLFAQSSIYDNGNIGIGTTTPAQKLVVNGGASVSQLGIGNSEMFADLDITGNMLGIRNNDAPWDNLWLTVDGGNANINASGADLGLSFNVGNNAAGTYGDAQMLTTAMTLLPSGKVGIGTTTPAQKLVVNGGASVNRLGIGNDSLLADLDLNGDTLGIRSGSNWENLWFNVNSTTANINASGAESGLNFKIGNNSTGAYGTGQTLTTAMTLLPSGNVGIGTTSPATKLDVVGGTAQRAVRLSSGRGQISNDGILLIQDSSINLAPNGTNQLIKFVNNAGNIIGSVSRVLNANTIAFNTTSDVRLKTAIRPTHYGLNDLMAIQVADYQYKGNTKAALQTGFLAQQLYEVYPTAVTKGNDADEKQPYMVDYSKLTPLLVKAVQELKIQLDELRQENQTLRVDNKRISELAEQIKELRQMVNTTATQAKR